MTSSDETVNDVQAVNETAPADESVPPQSDAALDAAVSAVEYDESDDFPVLQHVLIRYFRDLGPALASRRDITFVRRYLKHGESRAEFFGLEDELRTAYLHPKRSTPMVNEALNTDLTVEEVRRELSSLHDQITQRGAFSEEAIAEQEREEREKKATPDELLQGYFFRKVNPLPGKYRNISFPIWQPWVGSLALVILGSLLLTYVPWPTWLVWLPGILTALGLLGVLITSVSMWSMRSERLHPEREEERAQAKKAYAAKREERRQRREGWRRILS